MTGQSEELGTLLYFLALAAAALLYARLAYSSLATRRSTGRWQWGNFRRDSAIISRSGASADFCREFEPIFIQGTSAIMPAGDGRYPDRIDEEKSRNWIVALEKAIERGAAIDFIVTSPNERAKEIWRPLIQKSKGKFRLILIDKDGLPDDLRLEALRLDTFHPVLFFQGGIGDAHVAALGMWIESYHPLGCGDAFGIEVVGRESVKTDARFGQYHKLLRTLIGSKAAAIYEPPAASPTSRAA